MIGQIKDFLKKIPVRSFLRLDEKLGKSYISISFQDNFEEGQIPKPDFGFSYDLMNEYDFNVIMFSLKFISNNINKYNN